MTVNYLLMYDQINENNRNNVNVGHGINYLNDYHHLSENHINIEGINIFCILYYIALKIYLAQILEKKLYIDEYTKAFINRSY